MMSEPGPGKALSDLGLTHPLNPRITGLSVDSREVKPGHLFCAMPGVNLHGATFIEYAQRMGAAAVLTDSAGAQIASDCTLPVVISEEPRAAMARAAALWFGGQPEVMIAVTGTNGKTSVATFTRQIWEHLGLKAVNFGTTGVEGSVAAALSHTTPEPLTLHRLLKNLKDQGVSHAAMEASSHGLEQRRLDAVTLGAAGFTNFTQDHLDYHDGFEAYFKAKAGLFARVLPQGATAVLNIDDPVAPRLVEIAKSRQISVLSVGNADFADLRLLGQRFDATGQDVRFSYGGEVHLVRLDLVGGFQASNALLAAGLAIASGSKAGDVFKALGHLTTVTGRMQLAATRANGAAVYVDYAHTPDALATALKAMRPHVMGRLVVVFGAGGDRDKGKRPMMGAAAKENADVLIVTDDNPRSEDPGQIRAAILESCPEASEIGDRATAILTGVDALGPGDALLIAGKGHETGQIVGDDLLEFNDSEQASVAVAALDGRGV